MANKSQQPQSEHASESTVLGGKVRLLQFRGGYRAGMDAALLAAAVEALPGERLLEAGCGVGAALLQVALRLPQVSLFGVERDPAALALARSNISLNDLQSRVEVRAGDVQAPFRQLELPVFDRAFANPPFFDEETALRGPAPERRGAWLADGGLEVWTRFLLQALRDKGEVTLIHRADRLFDILALLSPKAGSFRVRPIHPFPDQPAKRVLVRAQKAGRGPLVLLAPLVMHRKGGGGREDNRHTEEAEAILRGEADLSWT